MPPPSQPADVCIAEFRRWIAKANVEGVPRSDMQLRLSHRDLSNLKRNSGVRLDEISFDAGVMRFLGVEIVTAGSSVSSLDRRLG